MGLFHVHLPLRKGDSGLRFDALLGEAPGEGAGETPTGEPLGQSLNLGTGITATEAQLGEGGSCGALLGPLSMLLDDA